MKRVLVNKPIHDDALERLAQEVELLTPFDASSNEIMQLLPDVHAVVLCAGLKMFADEIAIASKIEVIGRHGVGLDIVDLQEATRRKIPVVYTPYGPTESTAEHAFMLMMATTRQLTYLDREIRKGNFNVRDVVVGFELKGANVGVVGFGHIGQRFAEMCRNALNMSVYVFDPFVDPEKIVTWGATKCDNLQEMLTLVDVVSLHIPSTRETRNLINLEALHLLGSKGYLINTSRGAVVDEPALVQALREGIIAGAGLDVYNPEPPDGNNPLFALDNVVLTPHLASFTEQGRRRMGLMVAEDVINVLSGNQPEYLANPEIYSM